MSNFDHLAYHNLQCMCSLYRIGSMQRSNPKYGFSDLGQEVMDTLENARGILKQLRIFCHVMQLVWLLFILIE